MRIFVAGATGVIGVRLVPLLVGAGHVVAGMTRSPDNVSALRAQGAQPDAVVDRLTDLPDRLDDLQASAAANDRMRTEGTRNLVEAAQAAGATHFVAQSIAWRPAGRAAAVDVHERQVLEIGGVVARYGRLHGPGTYYERALPPPPRVHIDAAVSATPPLLEAPSGIVTIVDR